MTLTELRAIAQQSGIANFYTLQTEKELILAIQKARGEICCYQSDFRLQCQDMECEWRVGCLRRIAEWRR